MINRMLLQTDPETVVTGGLPGTAQFTLQALNRMRTEMGRNNARFNLWGEPAQDGDTELTMDMIDRMIAQIPQGNRRVSGLPGTAGFTPEELNRMLELMTTQGINFNYQGNPALPGDEILSREMINRMIVQLDPEAILTGGREGTALFTLDALNKMRTEMDSNNARFNFRGEPAQGTDPVLTMEMIDQMIGQIPQGTRRTKTISVANTARFTMEDLIRMLRMMSTDGTEYNYQGQVAQANDAVLTREMINRMILALEPETVLTGGLRGTAPFTLQALNRMRRQMQVSNALFNYRGERAQQGDSVLTIGMIDEMISQIPQGVRRTSMPGTADFEIEDLTRMLRMMTTDGAEFNYRGNIAQEGEQRLTRAMINRMILQLDPEAVLSAELPGTAPFTLNDLIRMRTEMDRNNINFNIRGERAGPTDTLLTSEMINQMFGQIPQGIRRVSLPGIAGFTMEDLNRMQRRMTTDGLEFNYQGNVAQPGDERLTWAMINNMILQLNPEAVLTAELPGTSQFTLNDLNRMRTEMDRNNVNFNLRGERAGPTDTLLTSEMINQMIGQIPQGVPTTPVGTPSGRIETAKFTIAQLNTMLADIDANNAQYNTNGQRFSPGDVLLTRDMILTMISQFPATTESGVRFGRFSLADVNRMIAEMQDTFDPQLFNFNGQPAGRDEPTLSLTQLESIRDRLRGSGATTFGLGQIRPEDIQRMIEQIRVNPSTTFNFQGQPAGAGDPVLSIEQLNGLLRLLQDQAIPAVRPSGSESSIIDLNPRPSGETASGTSTGTVVTVTGGTVAQPVQRGTPSETVVTVTGGTGTQPVQPGTPDRAVVTATDGTGTQPVQPGTPTETVVTVTGGTGTQPVQPGTPDRAVVTVTGGTGTQPVQPGTPDRAVVTVTGGTGTQPVQPGTPTETVVTVTGGTGTQPVQPGTPDRTVVTVTGGTGTQPVQPGTPDRTVVTVTGGTGTQPVQPITPDKSVVTVTGGTGTRPVQTETPDRTVVTVTGGTGTQPVQPGTPDKAVVTVTGGTGTRPVQTGTPDRAVVTVTGVTGTQPVQTGTPDRTVVTVTGGTGTQPVQTGTPDRTVVTVTSGTGTQPVQPITPDKTVVTVTGGTGTQPVRTGTPDRTVVTVTGGTGTQPVQTGTPNRTVVSVTGGTGTQLVQTGTPDRTVVTVIGGTGTQPVQTGTPDRTVVTVTGGTGTQPVQPITPDKTVVTVTGGTGTQPVRTGTPDRTVVTVTGGTGTQPVQTGTPDRTVVTVTGGTGTQPVQTGTPDRTVVTVTGGTGTQPVRTGTPDRTVVTVTGGTGTQPVLPGSFVGRTRETTSTAVTGQTGVGTGDQTISGTIFIDPGWDSGQVHPWMKARLDPAQCLRSCNLQICYLPYDGDCKSYVVCQRTAVGTYVAWKMRCAFGSYWGTGKLWTCERVEDLIRTGFQCQSDPCKNRSLISYPDIEERNCRTYWQCENGVSTPKCCEPHTRFDRNTLRCERDNAETCRAPCPLRIEGCNVPGARTQPFYDGNCRTYWNCEAGHPHPVCCPPGQAYDSERGVCENSAQCRDECPPEYSGDICGKVVGGTVVTSYALSDGNCRTYMRCNEKGYKEAYCCIPEHRYNTTSGLCERIRDPNDACNFEICPYTYKEKCRFEPVRDNEYQFYDSVSGVTHNCAPATHFVQDICTCDGSSLVKTCKKEVWAKFDQLDDKWSVKNYGDGWISVFGEMTKNRTAQGMTYGIFDGSSGMEVWRYDHTSFPEMTSEITFQPVAGGTQKQILLSNCKSTEGGNGPSFEVSLNPGTNELEIFLVTKFGSENIKLPYNPAGWNTLKIMFDGKTFIGVLEDPTGINKASVVPINLRGEIIAGLGPLRFGPCQDQSSNPMNNGFTGFISEAVFSKCVDTAAQDYINQVRARIPSMSG
ncbi:uncharacterized protein LOC127856296 isoform X2 [Dreissena polymorpha]|uniref:uncharacterized protein LOC127856296 isoform X2 n=1 Tax=Dreissena polymorpha TaxID=45954 RepID=UPI002264C57A|nr:uncharacterized protein LOC127856296 isoform X2 [Dreissena polymorpha]